MQQSHVKRSVSVPKRMLKSLFVCLFACLFACLLVCLFACSLVQLNAKTTILDKKVGTIRNFPPPPTQCWFAKTNCFEASYCIQYFFFCEESLAHDTNLHCKDCSEMHSGSCSQMTSSCKCSIQEPQRRIPSRSPTLTEEGGGYIC